VQPGESGKVPVKMASGHFSGHLAKSITVMTNAPGTGATLSLKIEGDVWQAVEVKPPSASFGRLTSDGANDPARVLKLEITNNLPDDAQLSDIRTSNPAFRVESAVVEPGKRFELTVGFASAPKVGSVAGTIELATGIKDMPTLSVPVNAYITPDVEVMPPNLSLPMDLMAASSRQLYVQNNSATPIKVSDVVASNSDIKIALEEMQPGMKYKLNVDLPAGYKAPPGGDSITFKTSSPNSPQVTVVVTQMKMPASAGGTTMTPAETKALLSSHKIDESAPDSSVRVTDPSVARPKRTEIPTPTQTAPKQLARPLPPRPTTMPAKS
jgi:hypothetical protein